MNTVKTKKAFFSISGEFVTDLARDWLYAEKRTYENVMNFLLSCMCGTDIPLNQLKEYANDILLGKRKFIGSTKDDSYCMVDDNTNVIEKYPMYFQRKYRKKKPMRQYITPHAHIKVQKETAKALNLNRTIMNLTKQNIDKKPITDYLENYGWLSPDGKFFEVEWGSHNSWASDYIDKNYPNVPTSPYEEGYYSCDFLIRKGWILLHNPYEIQGIANITDNEISNASKKQKEFLYDYFMERDMPSNAKNVWKEEP